ncbi:hypothetical protein TIFTF001_019272 [Ficus carica]|uniref:Uncharacterized protein n=1 Tax=Ficus carica TaxID=3494 RepID=A0AA88AWP7_FICCA|nr:hypothetical protein TIFTF001_019272 [Ficus carica]
MADRAAGLKICCDEKCGCALPCPGGLACGCTTGETTTSGSGDEHMKCSCGQHCGCNPCTCGLRVITPEVGKAYCKCGPACTCLTCAS